MLIEIEERPRLTTNRWAIFFAIVLLAIAALLSSASQASAQTKETLEAAAKVAKIEAKAAIEVAKLEASAKVAEAKAKVAKAKEAAKAAEKEVSETKKLAMTVASIRTHKDPDGGETFDKYEATPSGARFDLANHKVTASVEKKQAEENRPRVALVNGYGYSYGGGYGYGSYASYAPYGSRGIVRSPSKDQPTPKPTEGVARPRTSPKP